MSNFAIDGDTDNHRTPLFCTKPSNQQKIVVCPNCLTGRSVSINWYAGVCGDCKTYFNEETKAKSEDCKGMRNDEREASPEYLKDMAKSEKRAYDWRDNVIKRKKAGTYPTHPNIKE